MAVHVYDQQGLKYLVSAEKVGQLCIKGSVVQFQPCFPPPKQR